MSGSDFTGRVAVDATLPAVGERSPVASSSIELVKSVVENLRFTSEPGWGSVPIGVADNPEEMGRMRPACQHKKFRNKFEWPDVSGSDFAGKVAARFG